MNESEIKKEPASNNGTSAKFQLLFLIISGVTLGTLLYRHIDPFFFDSIDKLPVINIITPKEAKRLGNVFDKIGVKLIINNFKEFDFIKNNMTFLATLSFTFNPNITPFEKIKEFSFVRGKIISNHFYGLQQISPNLFLAEFFIEVNLSTELNYRHFPLDDHRLSIILISNELSPIEALHDPIVTETPVKPSATIRDWLLFDTQIYSGYLNYQGKSGIKKILNSAPCTVYVLSFTRNGTRPIATYFFPLFLIFFVAMLSMGMDPNQYKRSIIALSIACITALITYKFVIENISPKSSEFMLGDFIFYTILSVVFIVFVINTFTMQLNPKTKQKLTILLYLSTLSMFIYIVDFWGIKI